MQLDEMESSQVTAANGPGGWQRKSVKFDEQVQASINGEGGLLASIPVKLFNYSASEALSGLDTLVDCCSAEVSSLLSESGEALFLAAFRELTATQQGSNA